MLHVNLENGVSDNDWDVVQIKKAMVESSQKLVCLTIAEKINSQQPIQVCESSKIDILITELNAEDPLLQPYKDAGIAVL
jgi:DeoR/GlpR family transcriptional regulator of sugar metabolism